MNDVCPPPAVLTAANYKSGTKPVWCPGCSDFTVLGAITKALAKLQLPPHEVAVVSGIGCSSRIPNDQTGDHAKKDHSRDGE